ncbi:unnamed protein product [Rotaria sordida]|uniref:C2 domain-containing protein n=1 Tax=Rotaria sordida TaxID=392033 RepID=A0A819B1J3_9BILA|nr:unnamed protein product [Rotaria sordida]CAF1082973.1 unnamed protein product [Rotaria sordida]CAF1177139.1 unnamed protein product [Rotaria sordida]CAF1277244.1 unnamed protein product [Rotaria sordida]CAF1515648.1 unnamed protein product [Rotaria sordida]
MSHPYGTLQVTIVEGRQLKNKDIIGENDAYVEVYFDKDHKQRTKIVNNSNNPTWNETFTFNLQKDQDELHIDAYDDDIIGRDLIGSSKISLQKHVFGKGHLDIWLNFSVGIGRSTNGSIHVIVEHRK